MKKTSWEIIVAGILLLFVAIIITSKNEDEEQNQRQEKQRVAEVTAIQEAERAISNEKVRVINIEELAKFEDLQELSQLKSLEGLQRLKSLAALIPDSAKRGIVEELNAALSEFENDSFSINIDVDDNLVLLQKEYKTVEGEWISLSPGVYAYSKDFDASNLEDISVELTSGSLVLVGSDNSKGSIKVKASGDIAARELLKDMVSVSMLNKERKAEIRVSNLNRDNSNIQLQTTIIIPTSLNIISFIEAGHIEATNFEGDVEFKTSGGHITLKDLSGDITAFTEGGHIKLSNSKGDASLKSLGGHLTANEFIGDLEMRTSGGNVTGTKLTGSMNAFSSGGSINLQFNSVEGDVQARNGAGQIDIRLPSGINADVNISGTKVELDSRFPFKGEKNKNQVIGKIGSGGISVTAKTGYGTVLIEKNE